ncbi:MAG: 16S rRNA (adenine(1518)-N(6)/adenine(1519)-N(6))-dimethyltransferase RsmA [Lachnospiraceae bacterium]|nr:16S rRNA (adenine(1518)-N(6)/adenine(1519)-N(6))-dimethyltransferase RsmA [Lachnospiraceae bacterium]
MDKLVVPHAAAEVIKKHDFTFRKKYGQNFLIDGYVLEKIIRGAGVTKEDAVLEIGPGIGTMTQMLCETAGHVIAVEIDDKLIPILNETLEPYENVTLIHDDIIKADIKGLIEKYAGGRPVKVIANLPYYITTPIIMNFFENDIPVHSLTLMVQKEVGQRMKAEPGSKDYGALSLAIKYYADAYIVANVPRNCFMPRPNVDSVVIRLTRYTEPPVEVQDEKLLFRLIRAAFNQRRKTLVNGINNSPDLAFTKQQIEEAIVSIGRDAAVRGEALRIEEFALLANEFSKIEGSVK